MPSTSQLFPLQTAVLSFAGTLIAASGFLVEATSSGPVSSTLLPWLFLTAVGTTLALYANATLKAGFTTSGWEPRTLGHLRTFLGSWFWMYVSFAVLVYSLYMVYNHRVAEAWIFALLPLGMNRLLVAIRPVRNSQSAPNHHSQSLQS